jgi:PBP1b-binding outer membrane lipoprotein LpoB
MSTFNRNAEEIMKIIYAILVACALVSCSSERKAQYHVKKALKHGAKLIQDTDTIRITSIDSFPVIRHDSIVWEKFITTKDTVINFQNVYVPKTRFQTRIEYKERIKTLRIEGQTKWKTAKATQVVKYRTNWWIVLIAFVVGFILRFVLNSTFISRVQLFFKYL